MLLLLQGSAESVRANSSYRCSHTSPPLTRVLLLFRLPTLSIDSPGDRSAADLSTLRRVGVSGMLDQQSFPLLMRISSTTPCMLYQPRWGTLLMQLLLSAASARKQIRPSAA